MPAHASRFVSAPSRPKMALAVAMMDAGVRGGDGGRRRGLAATCNKQICAHSLRHWQLRTGFELGRGEARLGLQRTGRLCVWVGDQPLAEYYLKGRLALVP